MAEPSSTQSDATNATASERTALLSTGEQAEASRPEDDSGSGGVDPDSLHGRGRDSSKSLTSLACLSLGDAGLMLVIYAALKILVSFKPRYYAAPYAVLWYVDPVAAFALFAVCAWSVTLLRLRGGRINPWGTVNFFVVLSDLVVAFGLTINVGGVAEGLGRWDTGCYSYSDRPDPEGLGACERFAQAMLVIYWLYVGLGVVLTLTHALLFVIRCVAVYNTREAERCGRVSQWRFPAGQFSVEFTIKYLPLDQGGGDAPDRSTSGADQV
ncbi:hypothetical protein BJ170DRAFT_88473 [Xylariales sp. AK1849]|nr:hypothetical protein BJ170DRAFT_88473 [Xylariales sp. AK1849]